MLMALIATIYTQIICAVVLFYTHLNPIAVFVFVCLYYGAGNLSMQINSMQKYEKPIIYHASLVNLSLTFANVSALVLSIILVIVNWKLLLVALVITSFIFRRPSRSLARLIIVVPVAFFMGE